MTEDLLQVQTTVDCSVKAGQLADKLLDAQLAACVQISSAITSHYVWDGQVQRQQEFVLAIKTTRAAWNRLAALLQELHPYDEPQIVALPILEVTDSFATWVQQQIKVT